MSCRTRLRRVSPVSGQVTSKSQPEGFHLTGRVNSRFYCVTVTLRWSVFCAVSAPGFFHPGVHTQELALSRARRAIRLDVVSRGRDLDSRSRLTGAMFYR